MPGTGDDGAGRYFSLPIRLGNWIEPSEYHPVREILVIANFATNFHAFTQLLQVCKVIDKYLHWTFSDKHLIVIGDGPATEPQEAEYLWFIYCLEEKARKAGGQVHFIPGRREVFNLRESWRYLHPKYAVKKAGAKNPPAALYYGNNELCRWLRTKNLIEKVGSLLFVPAGVPPSVNEMPHVLSQFNEVVRKYFIDSSQSERRQETKALLKDPGDLFDYRGYFDGSVSAHQVDDTLRRFGVTTIITGNASAPAGVYFDGKVINVAAALEDRTKVGFIIRNGRCYRVDSDGNMEMIK